MTDEKAPEPEGQEQEQEQQRSTGMEGEDHLVAAIRSSMSYVRNGGATKQDCHKNQATKYVRSMLQGSWSAQGDGQLLTDIQSVMEGGCIYLTGFFCGAKDFSFLSALTRDLEAHAALAGEEGGKLINWSQHLKHENPEFSPTFQTILARLEEYFDVEIIASRLNFYRDGKDWKPFHHDSHAYGSNGKKEDFTMGASFGATRELSFLHEPSGQTFTFPQANGDIFAFDTEVNKRFKHGVPKVKGNPAQVGPRVSVIAWGRRRVLTERNSSTFKLADSSRTQQQDASYQQRQDRGAAASEGQYRSVLPHRPAQQTLSSTAGGGGTQARTTGGGDGGAEPAKAALDMTDMVDMVKKMVDKESGGSERAAKPASSTSSSSAGSTRRKGRLQHNWAK